MDTRKEIRQQTLTGERALFHVIYGGGSIEKP
ncbi:MAG: DUF3737 family protein [Lachnospiraceae bacterium]|nr:DUF3737 family protein [Lachnospiraceae bacterium]